MSLEFENIKIERLIVHEVFKRDIDREVVAPKCSNELTLLDRTGLQVFQDRIIKSMGNGSHSIEMAITDESESGTFQCCAKLLDGSDDHFIELSKHLALKLAQSQASRAIPGGILMVFNGTVTSVDKRYVGIIKAEMHNGFAKEEGFNAISLKHLSELLLTPQQKLYKIGFFAENNTPVYPDDLRAAEDFASYVYDHNMAQNESREAALYFYNTFLGCSVSLSSKKLTKDFYHLTKEFINNTRLPDEDKIDLQNSLYSYLKTSQQSTIRVNTFAEEFLPVENRDAYSNFMTQKDFPGHAITKDLTHLKGKLRRRKINFTSKIKLEGPADEFNNLVEIIETTETDTTVRISGRILDQD